MSDIRVTIGTREGFTSSLNLLFPNGLVLSTKEDITWMCKADKVLTRDQFIEVCKYLGLPDGEIQKIKL